MDNKNNNSVVSIGFGGLLTIVFIVLKLCGVIAWSWWWVLAPLWIPVALFIIGALLVVFGTWVSTLFDKKEK